MKFKIRLILTATAITAVAVGSRASDGKITTVLTNGRTVSVTALSPDIIKVENIPAGAVAPTSASVIMKAQPFKGSVNRTGAVEVLTTDNGVTATLNSSTGAVTISSGGNRAIADNGERTVAGGEQILRLSTMGSGSFYGAGERGYSYNLAGDTLVMYNKQNYGYTAGESRIKQMNITMPLFISSNGYAVLFDDYAAARMIMNNPIEYITESTEPVAYYFINGAGSLSEAVKQYTALTGRQDLPPFWSLGYITSKYGYKTEAETRGVIDTLKTNGYPVDGIVLDLYWYGKEQDMGRLAWDPDQWPSHKQMLSDLKEKGVNLIAISQPYVLRNGRGIDNYNMGVAEGLFVKDSTDSLGAPQEVKIWVGEGGMWDVSNPATRKWLRNRYKELTLDGVGGWWGDLGEPEVHPETGIHHNGKMARAYHNQYGNDWSSIIYDLFKEEFPDTRLMTMMRGGTAGLQRYSVYPWSTDVSRSWGGFAPQVVIMLNSGLSGMGYMSHDVGGFAIDEKRPVDPELYVRWLQLGTFSPILRTHAQQVAEPYRYTEHQDIILPLIRERYQWLPYNYTLAYENAAYGQPLVRPMGYYQADGSKFDNITDQYLWGRDVMIAPVMKQGATQRSIVFPEGVWVDMLNPAFSATGGDTITYNAPLNVLPRFVRAGGIIPMADYTMENTRNYDPSRYTINVYAKEGQNGSFTMFEDDRQSTRSLAENNYSLITFADTFNDGTLNISAVNSGSWKGAPAVKELTVKVHGINQAPKTLKINGKKASRKLWNFDKRTSTLSINTPWEITSPLNIDATF